MCSRKTIDELTIGNLRIKHLRSGVEIGRGKNHNFEFSRLVALILVPKIVEFRTRYC